MVRRRRPGQRKLRTRAHVIADLAINHVERQVLLAGYTVERVVYDYGVDLSMSTYSSAGEIENGDIAIQVKATDSPKFAADRTTVACRIDVGDAKSWLDQVRPVILVVYDAGGDHAYWVNFQRYAETEGLNDDATARVTVRVSVDNTFDRAAIDKIREFRDNLLHQIDGDLRHGE
jgi:Domain of unknown function (DUF4365)